MWTRTALLLLVCAPFALLADRAAAKPRVLVMRVDANYLPTATGEEMLTEHLIERINAGGEYEAVDLAGLNELSTALAGCKDIACEAQLAGAGAIDAIVGGTVSRLERQWLVSLYRVEVPSGRIQQRLPELIDGWDARAVLAAIDRLLLDLFQTPAKLASDAPRVLILDVRVERVERELGRALTEVALAEATAHGTHEVKSQRDTEAIVELAECTTGCDDLRREAALDYIIVIQFGRIGDSFVLTSKLLQLHGARALGRRSATFESADAVLFELAAQLSDLLALAPTRPAHAPAFIVRDPDERRETEKKLKEAAEEARKKHYRRRNR